MEKLEQFIDIHRNEFNNEEPSEGHFDRFLDKLESEKPVRRFLLNKPVLLKIAAIVVILVSFSAIILEFSVKKYRAGFSFSGNDNRFSQELRDAIRFYSDETSGQLEQLSSLTSKDQNINMISQSVIQELASLDQSTDELKEHLRQNPGNDLVEAAIIRNQQMKQTILTDIINRISNQQSH